MHPVGQIQTPAMEALVPQTRWVSSSASSSVLRASWERPVPTTARD